MKKVKEVLRSDKGLDTRTVYDRDEYLPGGLDVSTEKE